jgi:hypothetical protein
MTCHLCGERKARRACPALGRSICSVCCGTKRLVDIDCTPDCAHLAAAREHPAAAVKRRQEQDVAALMPSIRHLTERQQQLFFLFHSVIARHTPEGFARLADADVADAAGSMAATLETASKGVIYEHEPQSPPARKLVSELNELLAEVRQEGARVYDTEAAITLRAIETGARSLGAGPAGSATSYLELMGRLLGPVAPRQGRARAGSSLILP